MENPACYVDGFEVPDNWNNANCFFGNGYLDCDTRQHYNFHFFAKNHLGSTRAVFHADGTLENVYDYQTYGNDMCDRDNRLEAMTHKYNGKELETRNGLNLYDYGARLYDPITGQFTSIDPLCEKYYHVNPYAY